MRASEILRKLADVIDSAEGGEESSMGQSPETPNRAELTPVSVDHEDHTDKTHRFVPPLQTKIELLKKSVDVDSIYDQGGPTTTYGLVELICTTSALSGVFMNISGGAK